MTATNTVDTAATTVEANTVEATPVETTAIVDTTSNKDFLVAIQNLEDAGASSRAIALAAFGDASPATAGDRLARLMQSTASQARIASLLDGLNGIESDADYLPKAANQAERAATAKVVRHYVAALLVQSLDEQHNVLRVELCGDEGFGVYAEAGPLGFAGAGLGLVSKEKVDGRTVVKRTGAGFYLRADHLLSKATPVECVL